MKRERTTAEWAAMSGVLHWGAAHRVSKVGRKWVADLLGVRVVRNTKREAVALVDDWLDELSKTTG